MRKSFYTSVFALLLSAGTSHAATYVVDTKASTIAFSGTHADEPFDGKFADWTAEISFDPAHLADSHIKAVLKTESAKTGNAMYDGTLLQADWFDVKEFPNIIFASKTIIRNADQSYTATGDLTIRNITHPVDLKFTLSDLTQKPVTAKGQLTINRLEYDLGKKSDGNAEWVDKDIHLTVDIKADPQG